MTILPPAWRSRLIDYAQLVRLHRPIGILLLLWPTLWALWIAAGGFPDPLVLCVFVLGVALMRSAGCAINDFADRRFDREVRRTRERPLAAGRIQPWEAVIVFAALSLVAFALVLLLNPLTIALSLVALLLAVSYPFMKRLHSLPQAHLGAAFGWAIPMAFAAQVGNVPAVAWILFAATLVWAMVYDTLYAITDREDDLRIGVKSSAILFGRWDRLWIGIFQVIFFALLIAAGVVAELALPFYVGLVLAAYHGVRQQLAIRDRDPQQSFRAFLDNNWVGFWIFAGIVAAYALDFVARGGAGL